MIEIRIVFWIFLAIFAMLALEPDRSSEADYTSQDGELKTFNQLLQGRPLLNRGFLADDSKDQLLQTSFPGTSVEPKALVLNTAPNESNRPSASAKPITLRLVDRRA